MDVTALTDTELSDLYEAVKNETERRAFLANAPAMVSEINQKVLTAKGAKPGQPWKQPENAADGFPPGWTVGRRGEIWESLVPGNISEPGTGPFWKKKT